MSSTVEELLPDDSRVLDAAREYLAELEAGRAPDRASYFARFPELAAELTRCFDDIDFTHAGAQALQSAAPRREFGHLPNPLGDFEIVREVGRGGMGVVFEAVQLSLGRRVALKVLPLASALDAKHLQRFKAEANAAAQLQHPNIVPIYAVGNDRGIHYYAMQLISGRSLHTLIRELRGDPGEATGATTAKMGKTAPPSPPTGPKTVRPPRDPAAFRDVARIVAQIADALAYAHDAGVVHRDIKPANLILDDKGVVWITDFGLAQVTADVGLTRSGDIIGTLHYMSPEQASGKQLLIDHRADVYSLGATLYELLTLTPVFSGQDHHTLMIQIVTRDPIPPRHVEPGIPLDLETIVLKALAKTREERYATAGELAADLRRFLDGHPIQARRPGTLERAGKWLRRHPAYRNAAAALLVFGIVLLAISTGLIFREQRKTSNAYKREKQRATEAEQRFELARRSANEMIQIADDELTDHVEQLHVRRRLLEAALRYYEELIALRRDDPDGQADLESTRDGVESVLADLAVMRAAERHMLLSGPDVKDDLGLTAQQRARLADVFQEIWDHGPLRHLDFPRMTKGERSQQLLAEMKEHESVIAGILTPAQFERLRQIALQIHGLHAFREPDIIAALSLTPEQQEQIRNIDRGPPHRPGPPGGPPRRPGPPGRRVRESAEAVSQVMRILTPEQVARWQELVGKPFIARHGPPPDGPGHPDGPPP
jgi:serine/threonine protein kinase